jgi:hypothetical protein
MSRELGYTVKFLTDAGANRITDEALAMKGLSHEEQLRHAALLGFMAAGGEDNILPIYDEEVVEDFIQDSTLHIENDGVGDFTLEPVGRDADENFGSRWSTAQIVAAAQRQVQQEMTPKYETQQETEEQ